MEEWAESRAWLEKSRLNKKWDIPSTNYQRKENTDGNGEDKSVDARWGRQLIKEIISNNYISFFTYCDKGAGKQKWLFRLNPSWTVTKKELSEITQY